MRFRSVTSRLFAGIALLLVCAFNAAAQNVKRVVIVKIDGLPAYYVDRFVKQRDPATGRSLLPWFDEVFYKNGTRVSNFYTRGMSLSGPSWGQLDSGQHLQIKGNVEYDRFTLHAYDYLNFFPYYVEYLKRKKADMPAVEVMDQLKIPLLCDVFPYEKRYTSQQLYQRGNNWEVLASGFANLFPKDLNGLIDEWTMGIGVRKITIDQAERDIVGKLVKRPDIDYFDYYDVSFDHVSHHNNDTPSRLVGLKELDRLIGRIWVAIQNSSRADETALILISDHGFNSDEQVYSQGFNLVKLLASHPGGGHHVITKRRLMLDYSLKGLNPFVTLIRNSSNESYYLKGQSDSYATALVDFDGNERSSIHLRENDLNILHILLQQLQIGKLSPEVRASVTDTFFQIVDKRRAGWQETVRQLGEELDALNRWIESQKPIIAKQPKKFSPQDIALGADKQARRITALTDIAINAESNYRKYILTLSNFLDLKRETFDAGKLKIKDYIAKGSMGESNTIYQLQNYVVGLSPDGLSLTAGKGLDMEKSFTRVNYFDFIHDQAVRNNVQEHISNHPIDFIAARIPLIAISDSLPIDPKPNEDAIWLYGGSDRQTLILSRVDSEGNRSFRYLPIVELRQDEAGKVSFQIKQWSEGFPLKVFEDVNLNLSGGDKLSWLNEWHSEIEWLRATHKTDYSNAIIGLNEQLDRHPILSQDDNGLSQDERLIQRFRQRQRRLTEADLLILANDHWNFDVRGFNPGGNHGSFFRVSTNSTFMIAGGTKTQIPRGLTVEEPYDGLSFVPTVLRLMGKVDDENRPLPELRARGFSRFPGRVIREITGSGKETSGH